MASILVYIELDGEQPRRASMEALGEGRRMATSLGAALHALVLVPGTRSVSAGHSAGLPADLPADLEDTWVRALGQAGADKVVVATASQVPGPVLWQTHGRALHAACERVTPNLVLIAATSTGRDIAPRLATRLGAWFLAEPSIEYGGRGQVVLSRPVFGGSLVRRVSLEDVRGVTVVTLTPGSYEPARGHDEAEALCLDLAMDPDKEPLGGSIEWVDSAADPGAFLDHARVIVVAGGGIASAETYALVGELARALGAELGATETLCSRGIAPAERVIGVGFRHVAPALYVVCGASGSPGHLGAVCSDATIIAINTDPEARVFRLATYGIVGRVETVIPALVASLAGRRAEPLTVAT